ncbi:AMP1 protein, partial [Dicaeum eximium]|nr:AMP1 protein [Dicaeum eximium]
MKILFLLFPLLLLFAEGASGSAIACWHGQGFCNRGRCPRGSNAVGRCGRGFVCCR